MESKVISDGVGHSRQIDVKINYNTLVTPTYFPSISSYGIKYSFNSLLKHFTESGYPRVLISAYDCFHQKSKLEQVCEQIEKANIPFVFLDSGVFEASRKKDENWNQELYSQISSKIKFSLYSSFDLLYTKHSENFVSETIQSVLESRKQVENVDFVPIVHGGPILLPKIIKQLVHEHPDLCDFIAISERDCGHTIFQRARTISRIRKILDKGKISNQSRILHLLGCGDPISILLFTYAGANSFDSLDWIKSVFDFDRTRLVNFSHLDLLNCDCLFCNRKVCYVEKVLTHNLWFYQNYMLNLKTHIQENNLGQILAEYFSKKSLNKILNA